MRHWIFVLFLSSTFASYSQDTTCNCIANLYSTIKATEKNYAGFPSKVIPQTHARYKNLIAALRAKARSVQNSKQCFYILKDYVRFFRDKHFALSYRNEQDVDNEVMDPDESYFEAGARKKRLAAL